LIGAKGEDPPKKLSHFGRAVNIQGSLFNVLREIAVCGDPAAVAEEAPQSPREELFMKKPAVGLFHNSSAESEAFRGNQQRVPPSTLRYSKNNKLYKNSQKIRVQYALTIIKYIILALIDYFF
jgi:hypothetical protein